MYSRVLRTINSTNVNQSTIVYRRKVKLDWSAKRILFLLIDIYLSVYVCVRTNEYCKMNLTICNLMREKKDLNNYYCRLQLMILSILNSDKIFQITWYVIYLIAHRIFFFELTPLFCKFVNLIVCSVSTKYIVWSGNACSETFMWNIKVKLYY